MGKRSVISLVFVLFGLVIAFQNCAGPIENGTDPSVAAQQKRNNDAPFAYDFTVNRFAYMSCVNGPETSDGQFLQKPGFFTFKVAAADDIGGTGNAGVKLSENFTGYVDANLPKRSDGNGGASTPRFEVKKLLRESIRNSSARLQLALRPVDQPAIRLQESEIEGQAYDFIMPGLTEDLVLDQLVQLQGGERLNFIDGGSGIAGRDFEGSIGFFDSQETQNEIRGDLANRKEAMVMLTVSALPAGGDASSGGGDEGPILAARSPYTYSDSDSLHVVYGLGLQPTFAQADSRNSGNPQHVMRSLKEFDMTLPPQDRTNKADWVCDSALRYMIFSPQDAEDDSLPVNCPKIPDPLTSANPAVLAEMEMLRSVLRPEQWYINIPGKCIVPKSGDCYPKDFPVQYETSLECGPGTTHDCAHFLSICYRTSND